MTAFDYLLYGVWVAVPTVFLLIALYEKLEEVSGKREREGGWKDPLGQALFLAGCVLVSYCIDKFIPYKAWGLSPYKTFLRIVILPAVCVVGASVIGPSKEPEPEKTPRLRYNRKNKE